MDTYLPALVASKTVKSLSGWGEYVMQRSGFMSTYAVMPVLNQMLETRQFSGRQ